MTTATLRDVQRRGTLALAARESQRVVVLWTQTILPPVVTALLFLAVFGGALGSRVGEIEGLPYLTFILPGLLVLTVAGSAFSNNSTSLFQAKSEGYIEDVLTSPLQPWHFTLAYMAGGLVRAFAAAAVLAAIATPLTGGSRTRRSLSPRSCSPGSFSRRSVSSRASGPTPSTSTRSSPTLSWCRSRCSAASSTRRALSMSPGLLSRGSTRSSTSLTRPEQVLRAFTKPLCGSRSR